MTRSPRSSFSILCARLTLAAFAASLPGPAAWAQAVERVAPAMPTAFSAPAIVAPSALSAIPASAAVTLSAPALGATPLPPAAVPAAAVPAASAQIPAAPMAAAALSASAAQSAALSSPGISADGARALSARSFEAASTPNADTPPSEPAGEPSDSHSGELRRRANKLDTVFHHTYRAGQLLTAGELIFHATALGESESLSKHLINILVSDGRFLELSGGRYVYSELGEYFGGEHPDEQVNRAGGFAQQGLRALNSGDGLEARAAGVSYLGAAYALLKEHSAHANATLQIKILFQNGALELMRDILREKAKKDPTSFPIEALGKLADVNFGAGLADPDLDEPTRLRLAELVSTARPNSADRGFDMLKEMLHGRLPGEAPPVQPAAAPAPAVGGAVSVAPAAKVVDFSALDRSAYENLYKFGTDLTQKAVDGMTPVIGRKSELRQIVKTLIRVKKNNPLLIGEPGVGKSELINGLAQMVVAGEIPHLRGKNIVKIDIAAVVAGTRNRGEFEERLKSIISEAQKSEGRVLLFIDEIHMIMKAGDAEGGTTAAQILKDALADGKLSLIGATTLNEFRHIEKDGALMRRFNAITLKAPTKKEAVAIVEGVKAVYERKHGVTIPSETVKMAVTLAARYITDRQLPDSVLDLLDDAAAEVELAAFEAMNAGTQAPSRVVTPNSVAHEVYLRTGIPADTLTADKRARLKKLPADLAEKLIGQDEAVGAVADVVQQGELGYRNPKQPIGAFVFLGPTGVGKTELARALALIKFGSEKSMVRIDMSEYQEKHSVARLISAPPGYVGHEEGGQLTEPIRRNGYQVILFDEIEKAHPDVLDVLLQMLEDGIMTDGQGRRVDFTNTIIIMTSNIGGSLAGEQKKNPIGFATPRIAAATAVKGAAARRKSYLDAFKAKYRPELVNRVGEKRIIVFNEITEKSKLDLILSLRLLNLDHQLADKRMTVTLTAAARETILEDALTQTQYGARPVKQIVDRDINKALKDAELDDRIAEGDAVVVDWDAAAGAFRADKAR
ncbi:MAG: AAA family ATPase [Elusimicrobiota bacterium]